MNLLFYWLFSILFVNIYCVVCLLFVYLLLHFQLIYSSVDYFIRQLMILLIIIILSVIC